MTIVRNSVKQLECSLLVQIYDAVDWFILTSSSIYYKLFIIYSSLKTSVGFAYLA